MAKYDDIISLPHHQSVKHSPMPLSDRAAQFLPFAALTGYGAAVDEAGRLTDARADLEENYMETLNRQLQYLSEHLGEGPEAEITYFEKDSKKEGGAYRTVRGTVKKIDTYESRIVLLSGEKIPLNELFDVRICEDR